MDKITRQETFNKRYNECLAKQDGWCWVCIPEVVIRMNELYSENYTEEEVERYLFKEIEISSQYYELIT